MTTTTSVSPSATPNNPGQIVNILLKENLITQEQLAYASRIFAKLELQRPIVDILKDLKYVTDDQIWTSIRTNRLNIRFGRLLEELGYITQSELQEAFQIQKEEGHQRKIGEILVSKRFISERQMVEVLSLQMGFPFIEVEFIQIDATLFAKAPPRWYEQHRFIPVRLEEYNTVVAFADPLDPAALEAAKQSFGERIIPSVALEKSIQVVIKRFVTRGKNINPREIDDNAIQGIVHMLISNASQLGASDIHIEPMKDRLRIRFRRDGVVEQFKDLPEHIAPALVSRIKVMCGADIVEKKRHQTGQLFFDDDGAEIELRVSFFVTVFGEKVVMHLLKHPESIPPLETLGLYKRIRERYVEEVLEAPSGVILITGPVGSGKTTTLYSSITHINRPETSIITAEEPVEYMIDGVSQCSINPKINLTYEDTLRHIARQDPDVVVIGEIRDDLSAQTAIQCTFTGQKVLTTCHAEDTIGGLIRLLQMEIDPFFISSAIAGVLAQRLLRRVCPHCGWPTKPPAALVQRLGYSMAEISDGKFMKGRGCPKCNHTGYKGRVAVFELLILDETVRNAIVDQKNSREIRQIIFDNKGLVTLQEDGIVKAYEGVTTLEEVLRCLPRLNKPRPVSEIQRHLGAD